MLRKRPLITNYKDEKQLTFKTFEHLLNLQNPNDPHMTRIDQENDGILQPDLDDLFETSFQTQGEHKSLSDLPDYSDEVISQYYFDALNGRDPSDIPQVVDLDTEPDYVNFVKKSISNMLKEENEFSTNIKDVVEQKKL